MVALSLSIGGLTQTALADNGAIIHGKLAPFGSCALLNAGIEWEYLYKYGRTCPDHSTEGMTKENGRDMVMAMIKAADTKTINNQYIEDGISYSIMWVALMTADAEMVKLLAGILRN